MKKFVIRDVTEKDLEEQREFAPFKKEPTSAAWKYIDEMNATGDRSAGRKVGWCQVVSGGWGIFEDQDERDERVDHSDCRFPHVCPICSAPAYIWFTTIECSAGGHP